MANNRVKFKVKDIDRGYKVFVKEIADIKNVYVLVGLQAGDKADKRVKRKGSSDLIVRTDIDIAEIGAANEFGTKTTPSRPWMRQTWDKYNNELSRRIRAEYNAVIAGKKKAFQSLSVLGQWYQAKMQNEIVHGDFVENSPLTIKLKGSSRPLIDTGRMRQSVRYVIQRRP